MDHDSTIDVFQTLKARRQEEERFLDFLDKNRSVLHGKSGSQVGTFFHDNLGNYLHKRLRRPAVSEIALKEKFKKSFSHKLQFTKNRIARNGEYVLQRKHDFAISQDRVHVLIKKLQDEYASEVTEHLRRHSNWVSRTRELTSSLVADSSHSVALRLCDASVELSNISDALSFVPSFYSTVVKWFHQEGISFAKDSPLIPSFWVRQYRTPLRLETHRLLTSLCEGCLEGSMIPSVVGRRTRSVCVLLKPLVLSEPVCVDLAESLGWKGVFGRDFDYNLESLYSLLCDTSDDVLVFGFPRHPEELASLAQLFNPQPPVDEFLPRPKASHVDPFDKIVELDIADEVVLSDVLAELVDSETGATHDVRRLQLDTEEQLVRLVHSADPHFDVEQYASRSVTLKSNFDLIQEAHRPLYHRVKLESRVLTEELIEKIRNLIDSCDDPEWPVYDADVIYPALLANLQPLSNDLKEFFRNQWRSIEENYAEAVRRAFELLNETHRLMIAHLTRSRHEMRLFFGRPCSSQRLLIDFQQWHCNQIERCMRKMQRVKDECYLRLAALRDQLLQIENERKGEEETKQKDLTNATFRATLFELANNACTLLAQAEIDRWTATRSLMVDFNQILSDVELVPHVPHRKLNLVIDPSRVTVKKGQKKPTRASPPSRNRAENKLQPFDSPLFEQLEQIKKFVSDASVVYIRATTPISTRQVRRPVKDKNPFAAHKITALEEFSGGFADDDVYLVTKLDEIAELAHEVFQVIQQAFDVYVDDSTHWIQVHYERRKSIVNTAIGYLMRKVSEEAQLNHIVIIKENQCVIDTTKLIAPNEELPKIPPAFPSNLTEDISSQGAEAFVQGIVNFINESEMI